MTSAGLRARRNIRRPTDGDYGLFSEGAKSSLFGPYGTSVLDDFNNGAAQVLTARSGWGSTIYWTGEVSAQTNALPDGATVSATGAWKSNWWSRDGSMGDCEVWYTIGALGSFGQQIVSTRGNNQNTGNVTDYELAITPDNGVYSLDRYISGVPVNLDPGNGRTTGGTSMATGDAIALASIGPIHEVWYKPVGTPWRLVTASTDATTATGVLGLQLRWNTSIGSISDFGGGPLFGAQAVSLRDALIVRPRRVWAGRS